MPGRNKILGAIGVAIIGVVAFLYTATRESGPEFDRSCRSESGHAWSVHLRNALRGLSWGVAAGAGKLAPASPQWEITRAAP